MFNHELEPEQKGFFGRLKDRIANGANLSLGKESASTLECCETTGCNCSQAVDAFQKEIDRTRDVRLPAVQGSIDGLGIVADGVTLDADPLVNSIDMIFPEIIERFFKKDYEKQRDSASPQQN